MEITIAIMAGGKSERIGTDKASILIDGVPMLERVARASAATGRRVMVIGRERPENWRLEEITFEVDRISNAGPLGGLSTALEKSGTAILAIACDMPRLTTETIGWLLAAADEKPVSLGLITENQGQIEPLFSIYTQGCLPIIRARIDLGKLSLQGLALQGRFTFITPPPDVCRALLNVNTQEDLEQLKGN